VRAIRQDEFTVLVPSDAGHQEQLDLMRPTEWDVDGWRVLCSCGWQAVNCYEAEALAIEKARDHQRREMAKQAKKAVLIQ
jgi:hypothetical protein